MTNTRLLLPLLLLLVVSTTQAQRTRVPNSHAPGQEQAAPKDTRKHPKVDPDPQPSSVDLPPEVSSVLMEEGISVDELGEMRVADSYTDGASGVRHTWYRQQWKGLDVFNSEVAVHQRADGSVIALTQSLASELARKAPDASPGITPGAALTAVLAKDGIALPTPRANRTDEALRTTWFDGTAFGGMEPFAQLMWLRHGEEVRLVWNVNYQSPKGDHWWNVRVDARSGAELERNDWTSQCVFDGPDHADHVHGEASCTIPLAAAPPPAAPNDYRVYPMPVESPIHGARALHNAPWTQALNASPYGWHDTDGVPGAEHTITRGNNVLAQDDLDGNNATAGYSPDGGPTLDFDFPIDLSNPPGTYLDAAITNLFYWNNMTHDVWYQYGFHEASGNFQTNNYGNGGLGSDHVLADAQDGSGTNNANFSSPPDGIMGRMQMFLWTTNPTPTFVVNSPPAVAGTYAAIASNFGPLFPAVPITQQLVLVDDGTASPTLACATLINGASLSGKIALMDRGICTFVDKVQHAQNAGAIACVVCNNLPGDPIPMAGTSGTITIPSLMISQADCLLLKAQLGSGVSLSLSSTGTPIIRDSGLDNGIVVHEYGHGISTRLVGGPSNSSCLGNAEQMGEGWSDWFGLMMTMEPGDAGADARGVSTYSNGQTPAGGGIRPAPYSTSFAVNNYTYASTNNTALTQPHGIGFVWCAMLWDMTWDLIAQYGYDPDLYNGTGGNNMAMQLVIDGLKLTPCSPGFVSARDAILAADVLNYGGANQALIRTAFARRGLGYYASQGSTTSRTDQVESFIAMGFPDDVCSAITLQVGTNGMFSSVNATLQPGEPAPPTGSCIGQMSWCSEPSNTVWFQFVAPPSGRVSLNFGSTQNWDSQIALWSAPTCADLLTGGAVLLAANDDITGAAPYHAAIEPICVTPGQTYFVQVDGYSDQTSSAFELVLVAEPELIWYADADADGFGSSAQGSNVLSEGFDDLAAALASGWSQTNLSDPLGFQTYLQGDANVFPANAGAANSYVAVNYQSGSGTSTLSNWLFTPEVALQNGMQFSFLARSVNSIYPDRLQARLSTSGSSTNVGATATSVGDFTTLLVDINPTYSQGGFPGTWTQYTATISGLLGPVNGRIAFRYFVENGGPTGVNSDYIGIDDVLLTAPGILTGCTQPPGYVANDLDDCPAVPGLIGDVCDDGDPGTIDDSLDANCQCVGTPAAVQLSARVILDGAYDPITGLMRDNLRSLPAFQLSHPYGGAPFDHPGGETVSPLVLGASGPNAIVDWVLVELRDVNNPAIVMDSRAALLQRDGDIVDTDGVSPLTFTGTGHGIKHIVARHRNHLGVMTGSAITLSGSPASVDFTQPALATFGTEARKSTIDGKLALWPGNVNPDDQVKYLGAGDDRDLVLIAIGGTVLTTVLNNVYHQADVNMNGEVKYLGAGDDRDPILSTIGGVILNSVRVEQLP